VRRLQVILASVGAGIAAVLAIVAVHRETIAVVQRRGLLPRWDLATHLAHGWYDYHLLATGRLHLLLWDLWAQGYWPPGLSIVQVPLYLILGGDVTDGLWAGPIAFVLLAILGAALLVRADPDRSPLPAAGFVSLLLSSPYLLAYASLTMTEMLGALAQVVVLGAYALYMERRDRRTARLLAIALTVLFFVKYNYFVLAAVPLAIHFWLDRTASRGAAGRASQVRGVARALWASTTARLLVVYAAVVLVITLSGGFETRILGQRLSVRSVGSSGHIVLYLLLARLWYLHRQRRIDWRRVFALDPLIRPLLLWFVVPVLIWVAFPVPNHLRDIANLVINRPMGQAGLEAGLGAYLDALRTTYFFADWVLVAVLAGFASAAWHYGRRPALVQVLILAVPLQFAAVTMHHTRFTRFLLLTVVLLCTAAASEFGRWTAALVRARLVAVALAVLMMLAGVAASRRVVTEHRFRVLALEHYTDSQELRSAFADLRSLLTAEDRLVIAGQSNELSPALARLELGPPAGMPCYPYEIGGADRLDLSRATRVLVLQPDGVSPPADLVAAHETRMHAVRAAIDQRMLALEREYALGDLGIRLQLHRRTSPPASAVPCR
jgi:hypothetical protein